MDLKRSFIVTIIVLSAVLGCSATFAQTQDPPAPVPTPLAPTPPTTNQEALTEKGFFGINLGLMFLPVGLDGGYNFKDFGIRVSLDTEYSALEGYARFRLGEDSSYWYAGGGVGYSFIGSLVAFGSPFIDPPFGFNGLIGVQFENGFFAEYQPFALLGFFNSRSSGSSLFWIGAVHAKVGWRFFF
jgi:hypothetical protein